MQRHQIKRKRPTLQDAHIYHQAGSFRTGPEHFTSDDEREAELKRVSNELQEIVRQHFPRTANLEYALLKSHLIVEHVLTEYIRCYAHVAVAATDVRLTFAQKLEVAYLMGFGANEPTLIPTVELLNKVRNQVAHTFLLDRKAVDELIRINADDYENFKALTDRQRISWLRHLCVWISAVTAGRMEGIYAIVRWAEKT